MPYDALDLKVMALDRVYPKVPLKTLLQWAMEGRIAPGDLVRPVGSEVWLGVTQVPELRANLPQGLAREPSMHGEEDPELDADAATNWTTIRPRNKAEEAEVDMTPMIDVTFQLLIFFMLTNNLANPAPILVPEAVHGRGISPDGNQAIVIDDKGAYYLGEKVDPANLSPSLDALAQEVERNASSGSAPLDVIISAHKNSKHVQIRELVERLGEVPSVGNIRLGVEEKK